MISIESLKASKILLFFVFILFYSGCAGTNEASWSSCNYDSDCEILNAYYCGVIAVNKVNKKSVVNDIQAWRIKMDSKNSCSDKRKDYKAICKKKKCTVEKSALRKRV